MRLKKYTNTHYRQTAEISNVKTVALRLKGLAFSGFLANSDRPQNGKYALSKQVGRSLF
jgi:hypothetical protein